MSAQKTIKSATKKAAQPTGNAAAWGGRFAAETNAAAFDFGQSFTVDAALLPQDIVASKAHVKMLGATGIITKAEAKQIISGLDAIYADIMAGKLHLSEMTNGGPDPKSQSTANRPEDVHMAVEAELIKRIGDVGAKLHTARSRNDQVVTDFRLYCKDKAQVLYGLTNKLSDTLRGLAKQHTKTILPGYTHLKRAQPVLLAHHLLAYEQMFQRDAKRLLNAFVAANVSPLGSAALAGTVYPIDREMTAKELSFASITANSLDSVSDRDFALDLLYAVSVTQLHLSRLAEELILWSSDEFNFVELSDAYATGSSIMPQKKNPDFAELVRGKTGRVYGNLLSLLTTMKALPLAYNKDMQEDKEPVFDSVNTLANSLNVMIGMLLAASFNADAMYQATQSGHLTATDLADYLAKKGLPFRQAHKIVGEIVAASIKAGKQLWDWKLTEFKKFSNLIEQDVFDHITVEASLKAHNSAGGTSPEQVKKALN